MRLLFSLIFLYIYSFIPSLPYDIFFHFVFSHLSDLVYPHSLAEVRFYTHLRQREIQTRKIGETEREKNNKQVDKIGGITGTRGEKVPRGRLVCARVIVWRRSD